MRPDVIIRHPKEKLRKCSLQPLVGRADLLFYKATERFEFVADGYIQLAVDAPELTSADGGQPLLLLDSTWKLLPALQRCVRGKPLLRSLPAVATAYPRVSKLAEDPGNGLASVEALYLARAILGRADPSLLADYYWRDAFLRNWQEYSTRVFHPRMKN